MVGRTEWPKSLRFLAVLVLVGLNDEEGTLGGVFEHVVGVEVIREVEVAIVVVVILMMNVIASFLRPFLVL